MEFIVIGIISAFNLIIIKVKVSKGRYADACLDILAMLILAGMFGGTMGGMIIAMVASLIISIYLLKYPPGFSNTNFTKTIKDKYDEIRPRHS